MSDLPLPPPPAPTLFTATVRNLSLVQLMKVTNVVSYSLSDGVWFLVDIDGTVTAVPLARGLIVELRPES